MELMKEQLRDAVVNRTMALQVTLEDDFNVPDSKPDASVIIRTCGRVRIREKKQNGSKIYVKGSLFVKILYGSEEESHAYDGMDCEIPFDEIIHQNGEETAQTVTLLAELEDVSVHLIHSRKVSIKALLSFVAETVHITETEALTEAAKDGVKTQKQNLRMMVPAIRHRDTYRIREEQILPTNKGVIKRLLYWETEGKQYDSSVIYGQVEVSGVLEMFAVYTTDQNEEHLEFYRTSLPFRTSLPLEGSRDGMLSRITYLMNHENVSIITDEDGEERGFAVEGILEMEMQLFEETHKELLEDLYSTEGEILIDRVTVQTDEQVKRQKSTALLTGKYMLSEEEKAGQIVHASTRIRVEEVKEEANHLKISGMLEWQFLLQNEDEKQALQGCKTYVPFSCTAENGITGENSIVQVTPFSEEISYSLFGGKEIDWRLHAAFDLFILSKKEETVISQAQYRPFSKEERKEMPGIICYPVQEGDTLWSIAKKFHIAEETVREDNELGDEGVQTGKQLLIVKENFR